MIAPMVAILSDRVPSKIRGTMSAFYGAGSTIGAPIGTMLGALFIENLIPGFAVAGVLMFLGGVVAVIIIPKEQSADFLPKDEGSAKDILSSFRPPKFSTAHDFYKACGGRLLMMASYAMISQYTLYIFENYVGLTVQEAAKAMGTLSAVTFVVSLIGLAVSGPLSDKIKARKTPIAIACVLFIIGTLCPVMFRSVNGVLLYAAFAGLGYGVYIAVDGALNVDVIPEEAQHNRTGGKYIGFGNLANTCGQVLAPATTAMLVAVTGSYYTAFIVSALCALAGVSLILWIKSVK